MRTRKSYQVENLQIAFIHSRIFTRRTSLVFLIKEWINSLCHISTLLSRSGCFERRLFFNTQYRIIDGGTKIIIPAQITRGSLLLYIFKLSIHTSLMFKITQRFQIGRDFLIRIIREIREHVHDIRIGQRTDLERHHVS